LTAGGFGHKAAARHQPADFGAFTIRAGWFFAAQDQAFEFLAAFSALIFIDGHKNYSFGESETISAPFSRGSGRNRMFGIKVFVHAPVHESGMVYLND
jgi:hypothetical protein